MRRATPRVIWEPATRRFLSTLSLRRATVHYDNYNLHCVISIHALLAESDRRRTYQRDGKQAFLSTLSLRRATRKLPIRLPTALHFYPRSPCGERRRKSSRRCVLSSISIHALLAESDRLEFCDTAPRTYFYPRSPCGERQRTERHANSQQEFLSTLSLRRATVK